MTSVLKPGDDPSNFSGDVKPKRESKKKPPIVVGTIIEPEIDSNQNSEQIIINDKILENVQPVLSNEELVGPIPKNPTTTLPASKPHVLMNDRGQASTTNLDEMFRLANALFKGKGFPGWVRSPEQALAVCIYLKNLGLEVMTGIQHVCEVNGRITMWGEGPLAAVRASGKLKSIKEGFYTAEYKEICFKNRNLDEPVHFAYCVTVRADNGERKETWFSEKDASTATQGIKAIWTGYRRTMFKRKARAENLKDNFGDILQGAGIQEYDNESAPDMPALPAPNQPPSLADCFTKAADKEELKASETPLQN